MSQLTQLSTLALLGTARRLPQWAQRADALGELLAELADDKPERKRLQTAGALAVCQMAGQLPEPSPESQPPAADELALAVRAVARQLKLTDSPRTADFPLVLAGGFLLSSAALSSLLVARLNLCGIMPSSVTPVPDPVFGALTLARRALEA